jgi:hypothetical protein
MEAGNMTQNLIEAIARQVQHNCDIVDARHGADMGMCAYLLKMREYYRWEKGVGFRDRLPRDDIGDWLSRREAHWESLSGADYAEISVDGERFEPFDADAINDALAPLGLVYSGGLIGAGRPHFFLAHLESFDGPDGGDGYAVRVSGAELARGLSAPPAMSRERSIFLRREALRRYLWERLEIWRWNSPENALARAFGCYDFEGDLEGALDAMTERELQTALQHEIGELEAAALLGDDWEQMLLDLLGTPAELMARAARDCLADSLRTLPYLAERGHPASLHFLVGSLTNMRKEIFPGLVRAYQEWAKGAGLEPFTALAGVGQGHWTRVTREMLALHARHGPAAADPIAELVRDNYL